MKPEDVRGFVMEGSCASHQEFLARTRRAGDRAKRISFDKDREHVSGDDSVTAATTFGLTIRRSERLRLASIQARHFTGMIKRS